MPGRLQKDHGYRRGKGVKSASTTTKKTQAKAKKNNTPLKPNVQKFKIN